MNRPNTRFSSLVLSCLVLASGSSFGQEPEKKADPAEAARQESKFLTEIRQLTFEGKRAGEGYFSSDGRYMVFQSERDPANPFFQIFLQDRESGDITKVSPGQGKTTCAWVHPSGRYVMYGSTQFDPDALKKQAEELELRAKGEQKRYSWDYDPTYDLVAYDRIEKSYVQLTKEVGYDAEGCYSPDGDWIVFASNRRAYSGELNAHEAELFKVDPSSAMDLYLMRADGSDVKRLTDSIGYDGGPFFSHDGKKICWRRFAENGATAEIYTMNVDGSDVRSLTNLGAMSWAPYFHPSGDYLIFGTNLQGFTNFELYLVDAQGKHEPVRVTFTEGFDSLPVFTPDGSSLAWTTNRTAEKQSQIFTAAWNDAAARKALGLDADQSESVDTNPTEVARATSLQSNADYLAADVGRHVDYLCRPELGGRLTGTPGEKQATAYVAAYFESLGLKPAGKDGTWFEPFPFTARVELGSENRLTVGEQELKLDKDWRPLSFSQNGTFDPAEVVFAGYGIVAPAANGLDEYDSYVHLDVENKWVVVFRQMPRDIKPEQRQHFGGFSSLRYKAIEARDRGARGLIVVSGPTSDVREQLVRLEMDGSFSGNSLAVISVTDEVARPWFAAAGEEIGKLQKELDTGEPAMGFPLKDLKISANIDVRQIKEEGRNVLGWLRAGSEPTAEAIIIGAHIDHLGKGQGGTSLAKEEERGGVHRGADDNASGVAAMLEIAQQLAAAKRNGQLELKRDILFAGWSGEELGLLGSAHFTTEFYELYPNFKPKAPEGASEADAAHASPTSQGLYPALVAALNLDMVGRLRDNLVLQGIGSSPIWAQEIERRNAVVGLPVTLQNDTYLPTDASSFYLKGVPILSAFTGSHSEYHTPRDVPESLNYEGAAKIAKLFGLVARSLVTAETKPEFVRLDAPKQGGRARLQAYLGTVPDYAKTDVKGVLLGGVAKNGPAEKGGIRSGDVIVELAGKKIENIYDYTYAIEALKINEEIDVAVQRNGEVVKLKVTPGSRE